LMELLPTWQILDWPSTLVFGRMMDGKLVCKVFFCVPDCHLCGSVK